MIGVSMKFPEFLSGSPIPNADVVITTSRDNLCAVRAESYALNSKGVPGLKDDVCRADRGVRMI